MVGLGLGTRTEALAGIFVCQVLSGMSSPGVFGMSQILAGPSAAGRWVGIQNACGNFAGIVASLLTGWLVQLTHHYAEAFVLAAMVSVLGLVGWVWMIPRLAPLPWALPGAVADLEPAGQRSRGSNALPAGARISTIHYAGRPRGSPWYIGPHERRGRSRTGRVAGSCARARQAIAREEPAAGRGTGR